jgi:hypothetical protein
MWILNDFIEGSYRNQFDEDNPMVQTEGSGFRQPSEIPSETQSEANQEQYQENQEQYEESQEQSEANQEQYEENPEQYEGKGFE